MVRWRPSATRPFQVAPHAACVRVRFHVTSESKPLSRSTKCVLMSSTCLIQSPRRGDTRKAYILSGRDTSGRVTEVLYLQARLTYIILLNDMSREMVECTLQPGQEHPDAWWIHCNQGPCRLRLSTICTSYGGVALQWRRLCGCVHEGAMARPWTGNGQFCSAINCNNRRKTCTALSFFRFPVKLLCM